MSIDLRPYKNEVSYAKNGVSMGIAFSGLNDWGEDIYIMFTLFDVGDRLKITGYTVVE